MSFLNTLHLWTRFATPSRYVVCGVNRLDISCRSGKKQLIYFRKLLFTNRIVVNRDVKFPRQLDHCLTGDAVENVVCSRSEERRVGKECISRTRAICLCGLVNCTDTSS